MRWARVIAGILVVLAIVYIGVFVMPTGKPKSNTPTEERYFTGFGVSCYRSKCDVWHYGSGNYGGRSVVKRNLAPTEAENLAKRLNEEVGK